jgi:RHS repeat-associated protein
MGIDIGFSSQTPSLPKGGGAIAGLGETFTPDLSSGTGSYTIRLDSPNGPNDINPELALRYDSGAGNGPFGLGFSVPLPRLLRSSARGFARYDNSDRLILEGAGELLRLPDGSYRPEVDGGAWRAVAEGDGFRLTDREGLHYLLGTDATARLTGAGPAQVAAWHLQRIEDPLQNTVQFHWLRDGGQLYLDTMSYGPYLMQFVWEARSDVIRSGRTGFLVVTALRCATIELRLPAAPQPLLRRWSLSYAQDEANGTSLLRRVTLSGFDEVMTQLDTPALQLGYSVFAPRTLTLFSSTDLGITPGPLQRPGRRMELVDWDGDGLPDLLEIAAGGTTRLWPNLGDCTWGRPRALASLPLFATAAAGIAFADMSGDGVADLVRADRLADGYLPRVAGGGFERPVTWRQVPNAIRAFAPNSRLVDLDGDGRVDLLVSSNAGLALYYRADPDGWAPMPQQEARGMASAVNLADPHVFLADMSGSGSSDLVRVDGGGVTWWPYLGLGRWADPVTMRHPPELPFDVRPERLFLSDVDGDGCADLIYLDQGRVIYWINQSGNAFSVPRVIDFVPTGSIQNARLADMRGSGTAGLLWSNSGPFGRGTIYYYLDFSGDSKAHLLNRIDNGIGLVTEIDYTTSARAAVEAVRAGQPWTTFLPVVVPVIAQMATSDQATGQTSRARYRYFDGRYDGVLREFAGFGRVEHEQLGDASVETLRTTSWFHLGIDPEHPIEPPPASQRQRLRALRGRLLRRERAGPDGAAPFDRFEQDWIVKEERSGNVVFYVPRLAAMREINLDGARVASRITTTNLGWDAFGNVTETVQSSASDVDSRTLRTVNAYAQDPNGRFNTRLWRTRQFDTADSLVADTITEFDHATEGQVGAQGLVTRRSALVISDAMALDIYGAAPPDFAALGYHRHAGSDGWWVLLSEYERVVDAGGLSGSVTGPRAAKTRFRFDQNAMFPVQLTTPTGNTMQAKYDLRNATPSELIDAAGNIYLARHDALARLVTSIAPGDTVALPTTEYAYDSFALPTETTHRQRAESGALAMIETRERFDGAARMIERRVRDDIGDIIVASQEYNARGLPVRVFQAHRAAGAAYAPPPPSLPHAAFSYDALGRMTRTVNADGSVRSARYGPDWIEEADEESNRSDAGAPHAGVVTRRLFDATGRIRAVEQHLGPRVITTQYMYDIKGNLLRHVDGLGNTVQFAYDFLGRTLRVTRPEQTSVTLLDAAGNTVETRSGGQRVQREYDIANRPIAERTDTVPVVRYTWHDAAGAVPPDGDGFSVGHLIRIDDNAGTTRFGYDARGRITRKRWQAVGGGAEHALDFSYRSDDQPSRIVYPDGGAGRLALTQHYNTRGLLDAVPSVVQQFDYDLAGRRTGAHYANGTQEGMVYDARGRLASSTVTGPGGVLRELHYGLDLVGNLTGITSPDPKLVSTYVYDDFYRLTQAARGSGESWTYAYDDAGRLTHKSDVGDYHYGEGGVASTCLSSAGPDTFTYTTRGEMHSTPWGVQSFDAYGRLINTVGRDGLGRVDFTYDHAGRRVLARTSGNAAPAVDLLTPDSLYSFESGALVLHLAGCVRLAAGSGPVFLHRDHLGGLAMVTDAVGAVLERRYYDPYGALLTRTGVATGEPGSFGGGVADEWTGLLYLQSRYYHPRFGLFVSPDPVIGNMLDPLAWASYAYCHGNPVSYADPDGRSFWRVFILVVAIVALVALTIVTFGGSTPLNVGFAIGIGLGVVAGGVVGGVSAARAKGDAGDIITGILVGAAVGGWGAFISAGIGGAVLGKLGSGIVGSTVAGGLGGAVNGTAMGFAAGFGAKSEAATILTLMWQSALAGLVTGAALGALTGAVNSGDIKKPDLGAEYDKKLSEFSRPEAGAKAPAPDMSGTNPDVGSRAAALSPANPTSPSAAASKVGSWVAKPALGAGEYYAGELGKMLPVQVLAADLAGGAWGVFHDDITTYLRRHDVKIEF